MNEMYVLLMSAATLGVIHTLLGPDHYLPFIVLSKARNWTRTRTMWITFISGVEANRGNVVGWMLIAFGLLYSAYGIFKYFRRGTHVHFPAFLRPKSIRHKDLHLADKDLKKENDAGRLTPWILFLIFVFGPCEVLIPMLVYPAAEHSGLGIFLVALVFGTATIGTMLVVVWLGYKGLSFIKLKGKEYRIHLFAGAVILLAGIGMQFLGL